MEISYTACCIFTHLFNIPGGINQGKDLFPSQLLCCRGDVLYCVSEASSSELAAAKNGLTCIWGWGKERQHKVTLYCQWPGLLTKMEMIKKDLGGAHKSTDLCSASWYGWSSVKALNSSKTGLCFLVRGSVSEAKQLKLSREVSERSQEVMSLAWNCVTGRILWSQFS